MIDEYTKKILRRCDIKQERYIEIDFSDAYRKMKSFSPTEILTGDFEGNWVKWTQETFMRAMP